MANSPFKKYSKEALVRFLEFEFFSPSESHLKLLDSYERVAKSSRLTREMQANTEALLKTKSARKMHKLNANFEKLVQRSKKMDRQVK
jgi:hypothetical protein